MARNPIFLATNRVFQNNNHALISTTPDVVPVVDSVYAISANEYIVAQQNTGVVFTIAQKQALVQFAENMGTAGIYDKMVALYLYIGVDVNTELNMVNTAMYTLNFTNSVIRNQQGVIINGASGETNISLSTIEPNDYSWGYFSTRGNSSTRDTMGTDANENLYTYYKSKNKNTMYIKNFGEYNLELCASNNPYEQYMNAGFSCLTSSASGVSLSKNGVQLANTTMQSGWKGSTINIPQQTEDSNRQYSLSFVSQALTENQQLLMNSYVTDVMSAFGRYSVSNQAQKYIDRVIDDSGVVYDRLAINTAFEKITEWGINVMYSHWTSPRFGYKLNEDNEVIKRYCLFNRDAEPQYNGGYWDLVEETDLPPQMNVTSETAFVISGFTWDDAKLTSVVTCVAKDALYQYLMYPLIEHSENWNNDHSWLLGVDVHNGGSIGGVSNPGCYATTQQIPTENVSHSYALVVDPTQFTYDTQTVFRFDGVVASYYVENSYVDNTPYTSDPIYLGKRGNDSNCWYGYINDVFFTNKTLDTTAIEWLESQKNMYTIP